VPYHVRITLTARKNRRPGVTVLNRGAFWIEERIAGPRRQGSDIFIDGRVISWADVDRIQIFETDDDIEFLILGDATDLESYGRDVTEDFLIGPPGTGPRPEPDEATTFAANRRAVMVIYGHDTEANAALFDWLRSIGLQPQEWSQLIRASGSASPYIGQVLDQAFNDAQAVIAFFTPDEHVTAATSRDGQRTWRLQARPNVLIEAGMALSSHPTRTVLVVLGNQELPSDLAGRHYVRLDSTAVEPLHDLAERLHAAGCDTDTSGTAWLNPGRFPNRDHPPQSPTATATPPATSEYANLPPEEQLSPGGTGLS
jgi:predicted nucleotide-binding protein